MEQLGGTVRINVPAIKGRKVRKYAWEKIKIFGPDK